MNVIEHSQTEYASPVYFAQKKDGTSMFCVDHRKINAVTNHNSYPLPITDECMDSLEDAQAFQILTRIAAIVKLKWTLQAVKKTAITSKHGLYQFAFKPFGLKNPHITFQRVIYTLLFSDKWQLALPINGYINSPTCDSV